MQEKILELIKEKPLTIEECAKLLKKESTADFIFLNKTINSLIEQNLCFEYQDKIYLTENYQKGIVKKDATYLYLDNCFSISNENEFALEAGDEILYDVKNGVGRCLKVLKRKSVYVYGRIIFKRNRLYFYSNEYRYQDYKVLNLKEFKDILKDNDYVRCYISNYARHELKIEQIFGNANKQESLIQAILIANNAPKAFSKKAIEQVKSLSEDTALNKRIDLRSLDFVTIDNEDAKDFDDAIYVEKNDNGFLLYVAIADVSYYVKENSPLDLDAKKRGNSIYYPGHVIAMLPEKLSNNLCSLMPNVDRYALVCMMQFSFNGELVTYDLYEALIQSKYRLTYKIVDGILNHEKEWLNQYSNISSMLFKAYELSRILHHQRKENGGIEFNSQEPLIIEKNHQVIDIKIKQQLISEDIIEDFMIVTNQTIACHMSYLNYPLIYRNHDYPKPEKIKEFINLVKGLGYNFKTSKTEIKSIALQKCLNYFKENDNYSLISEMLLRSMSKAKYEANCFGHYGLGLEKYCHFTSPIRRYADLQVHRLLRKYLFENKIDELDNDNLNNVSIANSCNENEKKAVDIEREIMDLKRCLYMSNKVGQNFVGIISSVMSFGFYVQLDNTVEGLVHVRNFDTYFEYFDNKLTDGNTTYTVGQKVKVKLLDVNIYTRTIDFLVI